MTMALLSSKRSKDPVTQVGACIVNSSQRIIGIGYNGFPNGCDDDEFPWGKHNKDNYDNKSSYVCHAELNAILNSKQADTNGSTMYVTMFPCDECTKCIIQSGIKKVVFLNDKPTKRISNESKIHCRASERMLNAVGIGYSQFKPTKNIINQMKETIDSLQNALPNYELEIKSDDLSQ